ncbi:MAG TPA: CHRD domain-containing protein [Gaiellaceae bacterium]|jgi:hypothetical protein|nr:CHRD domain-containing protein [Gaiellaceae bacterium]
MRNRVTVLLGASVLLICGVASAATGKAKPTKYAAAMNTSQEVPKEKGASKAAGGTFNATLTGTSLKWKLSFSHLTGKATAAHIHLGAFGKSGPVVVPLCGPCKPNATGTVKITAKLAYEMLHGQTYVNVHTTKNPNGEIRGQVS